MANQPIKEKCDGICKTCPPIWQVQCAAQLAFRNNQNQKALDEKMNNILDKINDIFSTENMDSAPDPKESDQPQTASVQ